MPLRVALIAFAFACYCSAPARAEDAPFYAGKRLTVLVATGAGGDHDVYGRLLARHIGKHIPGEPQVIVQNMAGANGVAATNYAANSAPRDGTVLLLCTQNLPMTQALGAADLKFDLAQFTFVGNMLFANTIAYATADTQVKSIDDARQRELLLGSTAPNSLAAVHASLMNRVLGTHFRIVNGYKSAQETDLAIDRGEVNARAAVPWSAVKSMHPDWLREHRINVLIQVGLEKDRDLPDIPLLNDLVHSDGDLRIARFFSSIAAVGRPFSFAPGVPRDRVDVMRKAFDETLADPDLLADAARENLDVAPLAGVRLQQVVQDMLGADANLVKQAREIVGLD